jgi:hypothetical protein
MTYEVVLEESFQPASGGRAYHSETVVSTQPTMEDARRYALACNTKAYSNQFYSFRKLVDKSAQI